MRVLQQMEDAHIAVRAKITEAEDAEAKRSQLIGALLIGVFNQGAAYFVPTPENTRYTTNRPKTGAN